MLERKKEKKSFVKACFCASHKMLSLYDSQFFNFDNMQV